MKKSVVLCVIAFVILQLGFCVFFYYQTSGMIGRNLLSTMTVTAANIQRIEFTLIDEKNNPEFHEYLHSLYPGYFDVIKKELNVKYLYAYVSNEHTEFVYGFDENTPKDKLHAMMGVNDGYYDTVSPLLPNDRLIVVVKPLMNLKGEPMGYIEVNVDTEYFWKRYKEVLKSQAIYTLAFTFMFVMMMYYSMKKKTREQLEAIRVFSRIINVLTKSLSKKSDYTWAHSDNVATYACIIAGEMGANDEDLEVIRWAAQLHDIGKIGIPESLLDKPGKLTVEEYGIIKTHPLHGREIVAEIFKDNNVSDIERYKIITDIITYHHERWDGTGYPFGLKGDMIPLHARIIALADSFEAMVAQRPYKKSLTFDQAMQEITKCAGTHFDPEVVKAFVRCIEKGKLNV